MKPEYFVPLDSVLGVAILNKPEPLLRLPAVFAPLFSKKGPPTGGCHALPRLAILGSG